MTSRRRIKNGPVLQDVDANRVFDLTCVPLKGRRTKSSGKLGRLMAMPLEIIFNVGMNLHPKDLLQLSRCSRATRQVFMSKSSKHVWAAARGAIGLPDCPSDLNEPQYADLLFEKGCSLCQDSRTRKLYIRLRLRICTKCGEKYLRSNNHYGIHEHYKVLCMAPSEAFSFVTKRLYYLPQLEQLKNDYQALEKCMADDFMEQKIKEVKEREITSLDIEQWLKESMQEKQELGADIISARKASVMSKLSDLGYSDEDFVTRYDLKEWKWKQLIEQPKPLTAKVWQNIKPQLEETIMTRRTHCASAFRLERRYAGIVAFAERLHMYKNDNAQSVIYGPLFLAKDLLEVPEAKRVHEENDYRELLTDLRWKAVVNVLPNVIEEHAGKMIRDCTKIALEATSRVCSLPTTDDEYTQDRLRSPFSPAEEILEGPTARNNGLSEESPISLIVPPILLDGKSFFMYGKWCASFHELLRKRSLYPVYHAKAWVDESITVPQYSYKIAEVLLRQLGFKQNTSMSHLESKGRSFRCSRCNPDLTHNMTWHELVYHFVQAYEWHGKALQKMREKGVEVPIKNGHDLLLISTASAELGNGEEVDDSNDSSAMNPTLAAFAPSWGSRKKGYDYYSPFRLLLFDSDGGFVLRGEAAARDIHNNEDGFESDLHEDRDEDDEDRYLYSSRSQQPCEMCEKLGINKHYERKELRQHQKLKHGIETEVDPWLDDFMDRFWKR